MGIYYKDSTGKVHNFSSSLPIASKNGLGVIQVGENLEITEEGILNAQATSNVHYGTTEPTDDGIVMWINPEGDEDEVYLTTTNTVEYEPTGDYNPATKKYVDDNKITKTSQLTNDSNFAVDANYVHTDNNYTTIEKEKLATLENVVNTMFVDLQPVEEIQ